MEKDLLNELSSAVNQSESTTDEDSNGNESDKVSDELCSGAKADIVVVEECEQNLPTLLGSRQSPVYH